MLSWRTKLTKTAPRMLRPKVISHARNAITSEESITDRLVSLSLPGDQVREGEEGCQDAGDGDGGVHHLLAALLPHQRHLGDLHGLHQQPGRRLPGTALFHPCHKFQLHHHW